MDDEYELLPHREISHLRREIERLKGNPLMKEHKDRELLYAIDRLDGSMKKLYDLFDSVNDEIIKEYHAGEGPGKKLDKLLDQNKQIAEGILSLADGNHEKNEIKEKKDDGLLGKSEHKNEELQAFSEKEVESSNLGENIAQEAKAAPAHELDSRPRPTAPPVQKPAPRQNLVSPGHHPMRTNLPVQRPMPGLRPQSKPPAQVGLQMAHSDEPPVPVPPQLQQTSSLLNMQFPHAATGNIALNASRSRPNMMQQARPINLSSTNRKPVRRISKI